MYRDKGGHEQQGSVVFMTAIPLVKTKRNYGKVDGSLSPTRAHDTEKEKKRGTHKKRGMCGHAVG